MSKERSFAGHDRRRKLRIATPFPTRVRGVNVAGEAFDVESVLDNLSSDGLYLRLAEQVNEKSKLEFFIRMSGVEEQEAPTIQANGVVLRAETKPGGFVGLAVKLTHHRFT